MAVTGWHDASRGPQSWTRNVLGCDQSNYSSRIIFWCIFTLEPNTKIWPSSSRMLISVEVSISPEWSALHEIKSSRTHIEQESRAVARKPRDAAGVLLGLKFADDIRYKFKSSQVSKARGELSCSALPVALPFYLTELRKVGA